MNGVLQIYFRTVRPPSLQKQTVTSIGKPSPSEAVVVHLDQYRFRCRSFIESFAVWACTPSSRCSLSIALIRHHSNDEDLLMLPRPLKIYVCPRDIHFVYALSTLLAALCGKVSGLLLFAQRLEHLSDSLLSVLLCQVLGVAVSRVVTDADREKNFG